MPSEPSSAPQRLHPISLLFVLGGAARRLLLPGLFVLFFSPGSNYELAIMVFFVPAAVAAGVRYATYRYRLDPVEIVVREGVLTRNERHIPFGRIQNINLVQNPLHRLFDVAEVRLETASGDKPEAVIRVLSLDAVQELRDLVFAERDARRESADESGEPAPAGEREAELLVELPLRELVLLGLVSNRGMAVVAAILGVLWQFDRWADWESWADRFSQSQIPRATGTVLVGALLLIAFVVLLRVFSIGWSIMRYYGFRLTRRGRDLRAVYGLLTRYQATIPVHRIQLLSVKATPLDRLAGRCGVLVETAGASGGEEAEEGASQHRLWLAPIVSPQRADRLRRAVLPDVDLSSLEWQPLPPAARERLAKRTVALSLLATAVTVPLLRAWSIAVGVPLLAISLLHAHLWWKHAAWALAETAIAFRSGWWTRRESVVRFAKVQAVTLLKAPFDRRREMARLAVDTAGAGRSGHRMSIPYLPAETARRLHDRLAREAARRSFRW